MPVSKTAVSAKVQDLKQSQAGGLYWHDSWIKK